MNLNVDGSILGNSNISDFGELIRNADVARVHNFLDNIGYSNIFRAELMTLYHGLRMAWELGIKDLMCYSDSNLQNFSTMRTRRRNYDKDRLSVLPHCLLFQILSHLNVKQAVQTCILSTTWKIIWKDLHVLVLDSSYFKTFQTFTNFVSQIFSLRNHKASLQALKFQSRLGNIEPHLLKTILNYAFSPDLELLHMSMACNIEQFSLSNFSSHTLTSLNLAAYFKNFSRRPIFPNSLKLPALTNLSLNFFAFSCGGGDDGYADPFSAFKSLNTLIIQYCQVLDDKNLSISSVSLVNLTIQLSYHTPYKFELSTPNLCSFYFVGQPFQKLSGRNSYSNLSSIKHVHIVLPNWIRVENIPSILFNWLVELALMESLTISSKTLKILNLIPDSLKIDFPNLLNMKLLKIETHKLSSIPNGMGDFLLQNAPSAKRIIIELSARQIDDYMPNFFCIYFGLICNIHCVYILQKKQKLEE
ncbi:putative F-box/FBD/LRR-repeat protein At5g22610 [Vicia villosa]|uniref:putative F-box/FBD/LRR-repeat protein At5g22610 n=1 Tax=Vicia villosa TaxID=3911 RepID=UPI00273C0CBF|nr:putative F-box/FBD/LRR-repeat protein At5g22610 [Vicia villosa]